ncbi:MAG: PLP-dependent cysteine synthase family protein [Acidimicrobiia bacterium]
MRSRPDPAPLAPLLAATTPTVPLPVQGSGGTVWLKLDHLLPSGSTKDRMAGRIASDALADGRLHAGTTVVEASSGSTSIAFAMVSALVGVRFVAALPEGASSERLLLIRRYGGEVRTTPAEAGMAGAIALTEELAAADPEVLLPRQFTNPANARAHEERTGPELLASIGRVDGFVAAVGTGGTLMGVGRAVRAVCPGAVLARVVVADGELDAEQGGPSCTGIPGVVDCMSGLLDEAELGMEAPIAVTRAEAIATTRELCALGLPVGPSTGLNVAGARALAARLGPGSKVATMACDRVERYFSTDLFADLG